VFTGIDKELLAARYETAIAEEFGALAEFLGMTLETMLARSRAASRVIGQMHEIAQEYDFEMELLDLIRREGGVALLHRLEVVRFFDDNEASLRELDLDETLVAILKWRYRDQPTRFEWGYDPDALKQQDGWQKFSTGESRSVLLLICVPIFSEASRQAEAWAGAHLEPKWRVFSPTFNANPPLIGAEALGLSLSRSGRDQGPQVNPETGFDRRVPDSSRPNEALTQKDERELFYPLASLALQRAFTRSQQLAFQLSRCDER
jgi:hypothetical protein